MCSSDSFVGGKHLLAHTQSQGFSIYERLIDDKGEVRLFNIGHTFNKLSEQMNIMIVIGIARNHYITNPGSLITFFADILQIPTYVCLALQ